MSSFIGIRQPPGDPDVAVQSRRHRASDFRKELLRKAKKEAVSYIRMRQPFSIAGSAELHLGIFKDLKRTLHSGYPTKKWLLHCQSELAYGLPSWSSALPCLRFQSINPLRQPLVRFEGNAERQIFSSPDWACRFSSLLA